jgi:hypothetical protein
VTDEEKKKEREQRSVMDSVEILLYSRYSVESEREKVEEQQSEVKATMRRSKERV